MTWNDRWGTKLFLGGRTARWNGTEMNNLNQGQSPDFEQELVFIFFLILACILQCAQYFFVTFNFLANWNC